MQFRFGAFPDEMNGVDTAPALEHLGNLFNAVPPRIQKNDFRAWMDTVHEGLIILNPRIDEDHFPMIGWSRGGK